MTKEALIKLFERDLSKLSQEIASYTNEPDLWKVEDNIANSAGNLCLHLVGNLKHFVGMTLGNIPYERQRDKEFSDKNVPQQQLLQYINETKAAVLSTIETLDDAMLSALYPTEVFGYAMSAEFFLIHLYGHLSYHLGQVNYHRRLLNK